MVVGRDAESRRIFVYLIAFIRKTSGRTGWNHGPLVPRGTFPLRGKVRHGSIPSMSTLTTVPVDPKELRPLLHAMIDRLRDENLLVLHRVALELELDEVTDRLNEAFDEARAAGRLTPERIAEAIAAHRAAHPYRG